MMEITQAKMSQGATKAKPGVETQSKLDCIAASVSNDP